MSKVKIIAEVGSNYDGSLDEAKAYIIEASKCGCDAIKFQTLRKDKLIAPCHPAYNNFCNLELPDKWHYPLKLVADEYGIEFMSTPFYLEAVDLLESVGVKTYKIASGDITFTPLLEKVAQTHKPVLLSTGASSLRDIEQALNTLHKYGTSDITLLHAVSNYPPQWHENNLYALKIMSHYFDLPVGISDHSPSPIIPIMAVALGATVIEKHITFSRSSIGPDHFFATTIDELRDMVRQVRIAETALGTGSKLPCESEKLQQHNIRRGIYNTALEPATKGIWLRPEQGGKNC